MIHVSLWRDYLGYPGCDGPPAWWESEVVSDVDTVLVQEAVTPVHVDLQLQPVPRVLEVRPADGAEEPEEGLGPVHGEDDHLDGVVGRLLQLGQLGQVVPWQVILRAGCGGGRGQE